MKHLAICVSFLMTVLPCVVQTQDSLNDSIRTFHVLPPDTARLQQISLWATNYYVYPAAQDVKGIPLLDMLGQELGPKISPRDWCLGGIEGTIKVGGATYNYDGTNSPQQVDCMTTAKVHVAAIRYRRARGPFGDGIPGFKLVPWRTIAVVPGPVPYRTLLFVPKAAGQKLPDGTRHDGYFFAADTGSPEKIQGNHIDVFTGESLKPVLSIIGSAKDRTFQAFVVTDPTLIKAFDEVHR